MTPTEARLYDFSAAYGRFCQLVAQHLHNGVSVKRLSEAVRIKRPNFDPPLLGAQRANVRAHDAYHAARSTVGDNTLLDACRVAREAAAREWCVEMPAPSLER